MRRSHGRSAAATAEERFISYALSVITSRALPDVRDGLKPVQRRILYAMYQNLRLTAGARARKSAAVVGEVLGKYHPHGDQAAYEAMVRMAQPFALRYPLVHGEGNFGSLDGDGAAAMRYTEARLTAIAEELLRDIRHDTVDFRDNYDATLREPIVLPAALPQLLVNGSTGIAVGMATNIPPHNLREVVEALVALIDDPDLQTKDLLKYIKGPDFPTGGEILNTKRRAAPDLRDRPGRRCGCARSTSSRRSAAASAVVITSIPYTTNKASLVEEIAEHILSRKLPLAVDVRDESTDDVRVVVEMKPEASADAVMAYLFKHTSLQMNFNVNLTALVPTGRAGVGQPARLTLLELCRHFLDFRRDVVRRRLTHELGELRERLHILEGFLKLFDGVDRAIKIIRGAESRPDAQRGLMKAFDLDEVQADAILETRLYQLARLEIDKIREEQREKETRAKEIERLLKSDKALWNLVSSELRKVATEYGDARRTVLKAGAELAYDAEAYVVHEDATVVVTRDGWMKRVGEIKDPSSTRAARGRPGEVDPARQHARQPGALLQLRHRLRDEGHQRARHHRLRRAGAVAAQLQGRRAHRRRRPARAPAAEREETPRKAGQGELVQRRGAPPPEAAAVLLARRRADGARRPLAGRHRRRHGLLLPSRPERDDPQRPALRPHQGRRRAGHRRPGRRRHHHRRQRGGKVLSFPAEELPELAGAGRGVILMRLDARREPGRRRLPPGRRGRRSPIGDDGSERRISLPELAHRAQKGRKALKRITVVDLR